MSPLFIFANEHVITLERSAYAVAMTQQVPYAVGNGDCLSRGWPTPLLQSCWASEQVVESLIKHHDPDIEAMWTAYTQRVHYWAFMAIAIAHGIYVVNAWPTGSKAYRIHKRVAAWSEIVAYTIVGGVVSACIVTLTYPRGAAASVHNRVVLSMVTVCLLFFIKGFTLLVVRLSKNRYVGAFQCCPPHCVGHSLLIFLCRWTHLVLIGLVLFDLDRGGSFHLAQLYRFGASCYGLALALAIHGQTLAGRKRPTQWVWMKRVSDGGMHLCLFAGHVMLTAIGGERGFSLAWMVQHLDDRSLPIWRILLWDWIVVTLHFALTLGLLIYAKTDLPTRYKRKSAWKRHVATVSTIAKLMLVLVLLLGMLLLLTVKTYRIEPDWSALAQCRPTA